jgi:phosphomethylpyrimidine synthase
LDPAEIHRLAAKTRSKVASESGKAACHSELADDAEARDLQQERGVEVVQLGTREVSGIPDHDPVI